MNGDTAEAASTTIRVAEVSEIADLKRVEALFIEIWGRPYPAVSSDLMQAMRLNGNYIAGAYLGGDLVGGIVGFLGVTKEHGLHLHSHILGVRPAAQIRGVGYALKQHQRTWALDRDIKTITWTFDPLVRRNAYFNISKLGAGVAGYHRDLYGSMGDGINGSGESDRVLVAWDLDSERAVIAASSRLEDPDLDGLLRRGAVIALRDQQGRPSMAPTGADVVACQVPADIVALRQRQPDIARAWRHAVRDILGSALAAGMIVTGMDRAGHYILERH